MSNLPIKSGLLRENARARFHLPVWAQPFLLLPVFDSTVHRSCFYPMSLQPSIPDSSENMRTFLFWPHDIHTLLFTRNFLGLITECVSYRDMSDLPAPHAM